MRAANPEDRATNPLEHLLGHGPLKAGPGDHQQDRQGPAGQPVTAKEEGDRRQDGDDQELMLPGPVWSLLPLPRFFGGDEDGVARAEPEPGRPPKVLDTIHPLRQAAAAGQELRGSDQSAEDGPPGDDDRHQGQACDLEEPVRGPETRESWRHPWRQGTYEEEQIVRVGPRDRGDDRDPDDQREEVGDGDGDRLAIDARRQR